MFQGQQMLPDTLELSVSEFVALLNQTFDYAFPVVSIVGELANLRVSKGKWLYFDLKDASCTVKFFGTVFQLPGPLEDGMLLRVHGTPRLHNQYGFSVNVQSIQPAGEGTIRRAAELLQAQLAREGLFEEARKRSIPYPPRKIGLITSSQSAAYADFIKILGARWGGLEIHLIDVQVQGEIASSQIVNAVEQFNAEAVPPDVVVLIRGGGSAEDLAVFSTEQVTRAVAASRAPTLVAIGHEIDTSLAELVADMKASTPSNAAELLVPDRQQVYLQLQSNIRELQQAGQSRIRFIQQYLVQQRLYFDSRIYEVCRDQQKKVESHAQLLKAFDPEAIVRRGYAIIRREGKVIRHIDHLAVGAIVNVQISDANFDASIAQINTLKKV